MDRCLVRVSSIPAGQKRFGVDLKKFDFREGVSARYNSTSNNSSAIPRNYMANLTYDQSCPPHNSLVQVRLRGGQEVPH